MGVSSSIVKSIQANAKAKAKAGADDTLIMKYGHTMRLVTGHWGTRIARLGD
jgi:hypothetical protein